MSRVTFRYSFNITVHLEIQAVVFKNWGFIYLSKGANRMHSVISFLLTAKYKCTKYYCLHSNLSWRCQETITNRNPYLLIHTPHLVHASLPLRFYWTNQYSMFTSSKNEKRKKQQRNIRLPWLFFLCWRHASLRPHLGNPLVNTYVFESAYIC